MRAVFRKQGSDATPLIRNSLPSGKGAATGLTFQSTVLCFVLTRAVRSDSSTRLKSAMTSYISSEHTGIVRSSLRSSPTTSCSIPKVSSKETRPMTPHARRTPHVLQYSVDFFFRPEDSARPESFLRPCLFSANDADYRTPSVVGEAKFPTYGTKFLRFWFYCMFVGFSRSVWTIAPPRLGSPL